MTIKTEITTLAMSILFASAFWAQGVCAGDEYETVFVPEGKKLVLVDEDVEGCVVVEYIPLEDVDPGEACDPDALVISPSTGCDG